ncbi:hypothetical protein [Streptomyces noursei]
MTATSHLSCNDNEDKDKDKDTHRYIELARVSLMGWSVGRRCLSDE